MSAVLASIMALKARRAYSRKATSSGLLTCTRSILQERGGYGQLFSVINNVNLNFFVFPIMVLARDDAAETVNYNEQEKEKITKGNNVPGEAVR